MPILNAIGSSLVVVTAFGLTTALNYAFSGLIDRPLAAIFIAGGLVGSFGGALAAKDGRHYRTSDYGIFDTYLRCRRLHAMEKR